MACTSSALFARKMSANRHQNGYKWQLVWRNILLMSVIHSLALCGLYTKLFITHKWQTIVFNAIAIIIGGLGVTAGRHRLWSHRAYKAHTSVQMALAFAAASVYEQSIYRWCRDHRLHHKYSDTDADPYNARRGFFFSHIGWFFLRKHDDVLAKGKGIDMSDLEADPIVMFEHRYNKPLAVLCTGVLPILIPFWCWQERLDVCVLHCCFWRLAFVLHATWSVNSFAHIFGYRPYDGAIQPVENELVALMSMGEGFHNYHHTFPWDYKTAELGGDTRNLTTLLIDALAAVGLVTDRRTVTDAMLRKRMSRTGDVSLLRPRRNIRNFTLLFIVFILLA